MIVLLIIIFSIHSVFASFTDRNDDRTLFERIVDAMARDDGVDYGPKTDMLQGSPPIRLFEPKVITDQSVPIKSPIEPTLVKPPTPSHPVLVRYASKNSGTVRPIPKSCNVELLFINGLPVGYAKSFTEDWLYPAAVKFQDGSLEGRCANAILYFGRFNKWLDCSSYILSRYGGEIHKILEDSLNKYRNLDQDAFALPTVTDKLCDVYEPQLKMVTEGTCCVYSGGRYLFHNNKPYLISDIKQSHPDVFDDCWACLSIRDRRALTEAVALLSVKKLYLIDFQTLLKCTYVRVSFLVSGTCEPMIGCDPRYEQIYLKGSVNEESLCLSSSDDAYVDYLPLSKSNFNNTLEDLYLYNPTVTYNTYGLVEHKFVPYHCAVQSKLHCESRPSRRSSAVAVDYCSKPVLINGIVGPIVNTPSTRCVDFSGYYFVPASGMAICYRFSVSGDLQYCVCDVNRSPLNYKVVSVSFVDTLLDALGALLPTISVIIHLITKLIVGVVTALLKEVYKVLVILYNDLSPLIKEFLSLTDLWRDYVVDPVTKYILSPALSFTFRNAVVEVVVVYNMFRLRYSRLLSAFIAYMFHRVYIFFES